MTLTPEKLDELERLANAAAEVLCYRVGEVRDYVLYESVLRDLVRELDPATVSELVRAAKERRWVPVSESHPATAREVLVNSDGYVWLGYFTGDLWLRSPGHSILNNVTHWMPLPGVPHD